MKKYLFLLTLSSLCFSCFNSTDDVQSIKEQKWVYVEVVNETKNDTIRSFIYGQVRKRILDKIERSEKAKGIFFIRNTRFLNDDDLLQIYEDENDTGIIAYRIEHIQKIEVFKKDPVLIFKRDQLHENAIKVLLKYSQK